MDIFRVREEMRWKPIREIPLRVTYYARVSSERDEQLNSLKTSHSTMRNISNLIQDGLL